MSIFFRVYLEICNTSIYMSNLKRTSVNVSRRYRFIILLIHIENQLKVGFEISLTANGPIGNFHAILVVRVLCVAPSFHLKLHPKITNNEYGIFTFIQIYLISFQQFQQIPVRQPSIQMFLSGNKYSTFVRIFNARMEIWCV